MYSDGVVRNSGHQEWPSRPSPIGRPGMPPNSSSTNWKYWPLVVGPREDEGGAGPVACGHRQIRRALPERAALAVEEARVRVQPVRQRRGEARVEQRALRQRDLEHVVEPVVEQDLRVERHDHVDPEEQLAEPLVDVEVDRARRLVGGAGPVDVADVALAPDRQHHLEGAVAEAVVVDPVGEGHALLGHVLADQARHGLARALEQRVAGRGEGVTAEALADLTTRRSAARQPPISAIRSAAVHVGRARVVEDHGERGLVQHAVLEDLDRRDPQPLLPDRERLVVTWLPGTLPPTSIMWPNIEEKPTCSPSWKIGTITQPVVAVGDRPLAEVGVVQRNTSPSAMSPLELVDHLGDVGAELADDHLAALRCRSSGTRRAARGSSATWRRGARPRPSRSARSAARSRSGRA